MTGWSCSPATNWLQDWCLAASPTTRLPHFVQPCLLESMQPKRKKKMSKCWKNLNWIPNTPKCRGQKANNLLSMIYAQADNVTPWETCSKLTPTIWSTAMMMLTPNFGRKEEIKLTTAFPGWYNWGRIPQKLDGTFQNVLELASQLSPFSLQPSVYSVGGFMTPDRQRKWLIEAPT